MLRGAVVGFGRMGLTHYAILNNHPDVQFVAVCDPSRFMCKNIRRYIGVETFTDYEKMFRKMDLDFVIVASPTAYHAETLKSAIAHDVHMFVEKPFTLNARQAQEIKDALVEKLLVNQVGYVVRFNEVFVKVKELLEAGALGDLLHFKAEQYGPTVLTGSKGSWRSKKTEGGGALHDFASHSIDLVNYLIGYPREIQGSVLTSVYSEFVEDAVFSTFLYSNNLSGNLMCNWSDPSYRKPAYRFEIQGIKGKVIADLHAYKVFFRDEPEQDSGFSKGWNIRYITDFAEPVRFYLRGNEYTRQLDYFIDCIKQNRQSEMCSFEDGYRADSVIERIIQNSAERSL